MRLPHPKHVLSDASPQFPKPGSVINYLGECDPQDVGHAREDLDVVQIRYVAMNVRRGLSTKAVKIQSTNDSMKNEVPTASAIQDLPQEEHINVLQQRFSLLLVNPRLLCLEERQAMRLTMNRHVAIKAIGPGPTDTSSNITSVKRIPSAIRDGWIGQDCGRKLPNNPCCEVADVFMGRTIRQGACHASVSLWDQDN